MKLAIPGNKFIRYPELPIIADQKYIYAQELLVKSTRLGKVDFYDHQKEIYAALVNRPTQFSLMS